jgi:hypothetical protein
VINNFSGIIANMTINSISVEISIIWRYKKTETKATLNNSHKKIKQFIKISKVLVRITGQITTITEVNETEKINK